MWGLDLPHVQPCENVYRGVYQSDLRNAPWPSRRRATDWSDLTVESGAVRGVRSQWVSKEPLDYRGW